MSVSYTHLDVYKRQPLLKRNLRSTHALNILLVQAFITDGFGVIYQHALVKFHW